MNYTTCKEHLNSFKSYCETEKKSTYHTIRSYISDLHQFFDFWSFYEKQTTKTITLELIITHFLNHLKKHEKNSTQARKISCLNSYFLFLFQSKILKTPISLRRPSVELPKVETIPREAIVELLQNKNKYRLKSVRPYRDRAIIGILYATGIKSIELSSIKIQDIDFSNRSITIRPPHKRQRVVFFGAQTDQDLERYLKKERHLPKNTAEFLFLSIHQTPLTTRSIQRICLNFGTLLKPQIELTPKILRHSFALHLLERGTSIERVQELLGHATPASTERYIK